MIVQSCWLPYQMVGNQTLFFYGCSIIIINLRSQWNYRIRGFFDEEETLAFGGFGRKTSKFTPVKIKSWFQSSLRMRNCPRVD